MFVLANCWKVVAELTTPDRIEWCDGSDAEWNRLTKELVASGTLTPRVGRDGSRLGRGAGYYDRALANVPAHSTGGPIRICLVFDDEVDESVPSEPHDALIDLIVTPSQVIQIS